MSKAPKASRPISNRNRALLRAMGSRQNTYSTMGGRKKKGARAPKPITLPPINFGEPSKGEGA